MNCARVRAQLGDHLEGDLDLRTRVRVDAHLQACHGCSEELRELRATVALVRSLPRPSPEPGVVDAVMRRIDAGEARSAARLPALARRAFEPRLAAPLAASIAVFVVLTSLEGTPPGDRTLVAEADRAVDPRAARIWEGVRAPAVARRQIVPRLLGIERTAANRFYRPEATPVGFFGRVDPDVHRLDLDAQLDGLKLDPEEFLEWVGRIDEARRHATLAPLVVRARNRGDVEVVAGYLRTASHPLAASMAAHFERAGQPARNRRARPNPAVVSVSYP